MIASKVIACVCVVIGLLAPPANGDSLLVNGDFEDGTVNEAPPGWINLSGWSTGSEQAPSGLQMAMATQIGSGDVHSGSLEQIVYVPTTISSWNGTLSGYIRRQCLDANGTQQVNWARTRLEMFVSHDPPAPNSTWFGDVFGVLQCSADDQWHYVEKEVTLQGGYWYKVSIGFDNTNEGRTAYKAVDYVMADSIVLTPEPMTVLMLALVGLVPIRRRSRFIRR